MRFLSSDLIFPIETKPIPNGILVLGPDGKIIDVLLPNDPNAPDSARIEMFNGTLCPGFINTHCHLELSHMKGLVTEKTGLPAFIMQIVSRRHENADQKMEAIRLADEEMWRNGIVAVGDICNTADTLETKRASKIKYHSFVEVFSFDSSKAQEVLTEGIRVANTYAESGLKATIVPHAPYSVSEELFEGIRNQQATFPGSISIHNQETESENEMFISGTGELVEIFKKFGEDFSDFHPQFKSAIDYHLRQLPSNINSVLVHNTMTRAEEFAEANHHNENLYWCTCPNANQYIENRIPNIPMWLETGSKICVGTDSLASNHQLSILDELKLIQAKHPSIATQELLRIATINGAKALNLDNEKGSFRKGKLPGVILLKNLYAESSALAQVEIQRII
jgi:cytosine/adenosine deaminase-related metal-dependent hydrolase